jgi:glucosamine--fructose-6-phosphate aminotransferase (isomerizing)
MLLSPIQLFRGQSIAVLIRRLRQFGGRPIYWGRHLSQVPPGALVLFPLRTCTLNCGLAGIVSIRRGSGAAPPLPDLAALAQQAEAVAARNYKACLNGAPLEDAYLGGPNTIAGLLQGANAYKRHGAFRQIMTSADHQRQLAAIRDKLQQLVTSEVSEIKQRAGQMTAASLETVTQRLEMLQDAAWCLDREILRNIDKIKALRGDRPSPPSAAGAAFFYDVNAVLNSIDHLEVRGRDSAGLSLLFVLEDEVFDDFQKLLAAEAPTRVAELSSRQQPEILSNRSISQYVTTDPNGRRMVSLAFVYKVAAEIGSLGDNIRFIREQIRRDELLQCLADFPQRYHTVSSHTRWASVGAITEANCHPLDARTPNADRACPPIHVCLNGDIDNYQELRAEFEDRGGRIAEEITTDTKVIPLRIYHYLQQGHAVDEAFRLAVSDFEGSHAISMHTPLAPGKLFLAQRGSGQAIFVGLAEELYMPTSEVYGFIEQTQRFLKLDGEKVFEGPQGPTQGQIFVLDQQSPGGLDGVRAMYYDGSPIALRTADIRQTALTSRDINRQDFAHYFLKEISEAPDSVEKTLLNRWRVMPEAGGLLSVHLDERAVPTKIRRAFAAQRIRRIYFVGQGTAGVAALACANILRHYLEDPQVQINALKASELSGFVLEEEKRPQSLSDALVVAISQSGTTTDTNRTVDMARERGALTLAIVNRRDSDLTFKVDGVIYTSSGRDIEMSVASTKAFYSQIVAGALLSLFISGLGRQRDPTFVSDEIHELLVMPAKMRQVIAMQAAISQSAQRLATAKTYWAAVGSGPNKASADEIRIKLSELCYKTLSSDYVEDKKHIDLSSEPLIIVCAAGVRPSVIGDIIKDTAIFKAHKAAPVVIADEGENRFAPYAEDVFHIPPVPEHLAPILNTLVGHLWGYHAALAINEGSRLFFGLQDSIQQRLAAYAQQGLDVYEILLEKGFRQLFAEFYQAFQARRARRGWPAALGLETATDIMLLVKYMTGRLPVSDFELDFGVKGTARNMLDTFFATLSRAINNLARPIDAIKHQAKTVTVGTSRIAEKTEGILFEALREHDLQIAQLVNRNVIVLKHLQPIIAQIRGAILYRIAGLDLLGEISDETTIEIVRKTGELAALPSRVETDPRLKGTKAIIVRQGNVYIGKGRKDDRSILVIPAISDQPARSNQIEFLLLLNIAFQRSVPLPVKIKALGGKYSHIRNIVQENSIVWQDPYLEEIALEELFGRSAEKIGEQIVARRRA